ncbi:MAG TPA: response regulator [Terriglobales bacterium]|nr:response regulator [Terriglobales bacterium]
MDGDRTTLEALNEMLTSSFEIVGSLSSGMAVIEQAQTHNPDVIVLGVSLRDMSGFRIAKLLLERNSSRKIVFLLDDQDIGLLCLAFQLGAAGCVLKSQMTDLARVVEKVTGDQECGPSLEFFFPES